MARSIFCVISDDVDMIQKAKHFGHVNNIQVQTYSTTEWQQGLGKPGFLESLCGDMAAPLAPGSGTQSMGNVVAFPGVDKNAKKVSTMNELAAVAIENAIYEYNGNLTEAARALGIGRATLYRKVKQYQIDPGAARRHKKAA